MADFSPTAANVLASPNALISRGTAGVAITAGQTLGKASDGTMKLYGAAAAAPLNVFKGIALNNAAIGQPIDYATLDPNFTPGFAVAAGAVVAGSATPGSLAPIADLASGSVPTIVGEGIGNNQINLQPQSAGVAIP